jgi:hypothetical protein
MSTNQASARSRPSYSAAGAGFNDETRNAVSGAFDALSEWRQELAQLAERNSGAVFDKMAAAAKAMGWPSEFVEVTRSNMEKASKLQLQIIDQVMGIWEQQLKAPGAGFSIPSAMMEKFQPFPGMQFGAPLPGMPDMGAMGMNPLQFWMQAADMWQKSWASALSSWMEMQGGAGPKGNGGSRSAGSR